MLLRFSVENFRSFHGEATLSLVPAKSRIHPDHVMRGAGARRNVKGLPLAVLYGANASGKSNLVKAITFVQRLVVKGTRPDAGTGATPFRLDRSALDQPSRFELVLTHEDALYTYGFACTSREVTEEWLFAVTRRNEVRLFERVTENGKARLEVGPQLADSAEERQRLQFVAAGTRPNQLFLTEATERNVEGLAPLAHWFRDHLTVIQPDAMYGPLALRAHDDDTFREYLSRFLSVADTGISGVGLSSEAYREDRPLAGLPPAVVKRLLEDLDRSGGQTVFLPGGRTLVSQHSGEEDSRRVLTLTTHHRDHDGEIVHLDLGDESDGTLRLLHLVPALLDLTSNDDVIVVDELDRSLHPHISWLYVDAFLHGVTEHGHRGQMILTTHDTNLLDLELLRRDEIWFVEKDRHAASHLTSLAEFRLVRKDLRIDTGYLAGRFGAIPFVGDVERLFDDELREAGA